MAYFLGIDLGTSYFKAGIFDQCGTLCGLGRQAVIKNQSSPFISELAIDAFWRTIKTAIAQAAQQAAISPKEIKAVGYSSQANSFTALNLSGTELMPLLLWCDSRTETALPQVLQLWSQDDFLQTTGIGIEAGAGLMLNKVLWLKENLPQVWSRTSAIKTISDYLIFGLTEQNYSDLGTSSLLGIVDAKKRCYWKKAFEILGIDEGLFGTLIASGSQAGEITQKGSSLTGLRKGIPLYAGSLDHYIAALGAGLGDVADMSESTGTVVACVNMSDRFAPQKGVCISRSFQDGKYFQLAFDANGAISLEWYQRLFAPNYSLAALDEMAKKVGSCDGLRAMPRAYKYKGLEAFEGIRPNHSHGHFFRALMESISLTLNGLICKLTHTNKPEAVVSTGGGARSDFWLELKSEISGGCRFFPANCIEPACRAAAGLSTTDS